VFVFGLAFPFEDDDDDEEEEVVKRLEPENRSKALLGSGLL